MQNEKDFARYIAENRGMTNENPLYFKNRYRIPSARKRGHDYGSEGHYFVTICTKDRISWFGEIQNNIMCLSDVGSIVAQCWEQIPNHFNNICLDRWIIMPNHIHGIITITNNAETPHGASLPKTWKSGCLGVIINQFKSACAKHIHRIRHTDFAWQPRFYDHIIRPNEIGNVQKYITDNPSKWNEDSLYFL